MLMTAVRVRSLALRMFRVPHWLHMGQDSVQMGQDSAGRTGIACRADVYEWPVNFGRCANFACKYHFELEAGPVVKRDRWLQIACLIQVRYRTRCATQTAQGRTYRATATVGQRHHN